MRCSKPWHGRRNGFAFTKDTFYPKQAGRFAEIDLTAGLWPSKRYQDDFTVVFNLTNLGASNRDGGSVLCLTGLPDKQYVAPHRQIPKYLSR